MRHTVNNFKTYKTGLKSQNHTNIIIAQVFVKDAMLAKLSEILSRKKKESALV